jgi:predicted CoA-substrate-specific enzyme activase
MDIRSVVSEGRWNSGSHAPVIGLDLGSRASKGVLLNGDQVETVLIPTGVSMQQTAEELVASLLRASGLHRSDIEYIVGTGYGRITLSFHDIPYQIVTEISGHAMGAHAVLPQTRTIIDIGGQDSKALKVDPSNGKVVEFVMNDKCAAGTGRFLEKTALLLGLQLDELGPESLKADAPSPISSQCVVFAESEVISLRARGERANNLKARADVAAGVHLATARRVRNLLQRVRIEPDLVFTGGVSQNPGMWKALEDSIGHRFAKTPFDLTFAGALGAAVFAGRYQQTGVGNLANLGDMDPSERRHGSGPYIDAGEPQASAIAINLARSRAQNEHHVALGDALNRRSLPRGLDVPVIGVDIGSRSSKAVLIHGDRVEAALIPTGLFTQETADALIAELLQRACLERRQIAKIVGTGYGRIALTFPDIPFETVTEIKCHAMGAHAVVPTARTVIDIGGQDSKAIKVDPTNGNVVEFVMNDKCAAGTGRFLEKSAQTLGVELEPFGKLVFEAERPCDMSSQCVVFAETEIITLRAKAEGPATLSRKVTLPDIAAGVHISAARRVQNLLGRIGILDDLVFTGGVSNNPGMRRVLEELLGHKFTIPKADLIFAGALGAAVFAAKSVAQTVVHPIRANKACTEPISAEGRANSQARAAAFEDLRARIQRSQEAFATQPDGRKRFAYQCNYTPVELLSASGARHIRLFRAGDPETVARGERYTQSIYCDLTKSCLGYFENGDPLYKAVDGIYNFYTCNTVRRISEVLDRFAPVKLLNLPKNRFDPSSRAFFRRELVELRRDLEKKTGIVIQDEAIHQQILKHNLLRRLLRRISDLRKAPQPALTGREYLEIAKAYYYLEADEALAALERVYAVLEATRTADDSAQAPLRVMLAGSILADGDRTVHDIIEGEFGAAIVTEDACTGLRPFYHELQEDGDPLDALVNGYLDQAPCARMKPLGDAARFAASLASEYQAEGALYVYLKFCPVHSYGIKEYVTAFQRASLPVLELSNDYSQSTGGQIRTRLEAFVEVLHERRNRRATAARESQ